MQWTDCLTSVREALRDKWEDLLESASRKPWAWLALGLAVAFGYFAWEARHQNVRAARVLVDVFQSRFEALMLDLGVQIPRTLRQLQKMEKVDSRLSSIREWVKDPGLIVAVRVRPPGGGPNLLAGSIALLPAVGNGSLSACGGHDGVRSFGGFLLATLAIPYSLSGQESPSVQEGSLCVVAVLPTSEMSWVSIHEDEDVSFSLDSADGRLLIAREASLSSGIALRFLPFLAGTQDLAVRIPGREPILLARLAVWTPVQWVTFFVPALVCLLLYGMIRYLARWKDSIDSSPITKPALAVIAVNHGGPLLGFMADVLNAEVYLPADEEQGTRGRLRRGLRLLDELSKMCAMPAGASEPPLPERVQFELSFNGVLDLLASYVNPEKLPNSPSPIRLEPESSTRGSCPAEVSLTVPGLPLFACVYNSLDNAAKHGLPEKDGVVTVHIDVGTSQDSHSAYIAFRNKARKRERPRAVERFKPPTGEGRWGDFASSQVMKSYLGGTYRKQFEDTLANGGHEVVSVCITTLLISMAETEK